MQGPDDNEEKALRRTGLGMMLLFWLIALGLVGWWFHGMLEARRSPNANLAISHSGEPVILERSISGHFVAPGTINGQPVEFLLDTGATYLAVPGELAERLGLERGASAYFSTANGLARGYLTTIDQVGLGGLMAHEVRGSINPTLHGDTALLGMSFLSRFDIAISGDEMVLTPRGER